MQPSLPVQLLDSADHARDVYFQGSLLDIPGLHESNGERGERGGLGRPFPWSSSRIRCVISGARRIFQIFQNKALCTRRRRDTRAACFEEKVDMMMRE